MRNEVADMYANIGNSQQQLRYLLLMLNHESEVQVFFSSCSMCVCVCPSVCRPSLPDYVLDFGHVVVGQVCTQTVAIANTSWFPVSFSVDRSARAQSGFSVDLLRVVQLPQREAVECVVTFDPRAAGLERGPVEVVVPISV